MNKCVICGKEFVPYRTYGERQKTCSVECRKVYVRRYQREISRTDEYKKHSADLLRKRRNGSVICRICGKPIYRTFFPGEGSPWMHYECVINDCINTVKEGKPLTHKQLLRLDSRGYSKTEFMEEYADAIYN